MKPLAEVSLLTAGAPDSVFSRERLAAVPSLAAAVATPVDWQLVVALRRKASDLITRRLADAAQDDAPLSALDRRLLGRSVVRSVVADHAARLGADGRALWPVETEQAYAVAVEDAIFGFGRLQPLFEIPDAENIEIHGCDSVVVQYSDGRRATHPPVADSDEELVEAIRFLGESVTPARPFDDAHPTMTLALGDRHRLHAIGFGLSFRPSIAIRQHTLTQVSLPDLVAGGMLTEELARLLHAAVLGRKSIVISGDQGAGKTTLLRALIAAIPNNERFGTLETDYELLTHLQPGRANILALLNRKYGIREEDLMSAELQAVPAGPARYVGLDAALIGGYGQDDRVCVFTALSAFLDAQAPEHANCLIFWDKEEIGSVGATGMRARFFENAIAEMMALHGEEGDLRLRRALEEAGNKTPSAPSKKAERG